MTGKKVNILLLSLHAHTDGLRVPSETQNRLNHVTLKGRGAKTFLNVSTFNFVLNFIVL